MTKVGTHLILLQSQVVRMSQIPRQCLIAGIEGGGSDGREYIMCHEMGNHDVYGTVTHSRNGDEMIL
jgi:hypothetical protein